MERGVITPILDGMLVPNCGTLYHGAKHVGFFFSTYETPNLEGTPITILETPILKF